MPAGAQPLADVSALQAEVRRCRGIAEAAARVACYDAIVLPAGAPRADAAAAVPAPAAPSSAAAPAAQPRPPVAASAADDAAHARNFGLPQDLAPAGPSSIETSIDGPFDGWTPAARIRLANGQVWEIVDGSTASYQLHGPKVRVSRGLFGSFFLHVEGVAQTPRVRRVK
ncbi:MAG: hypothetical protein KIT17_21175 [Rubrivivax sp.]|nr:hypothetical protein [Rubrivivax sp.]